MKVFIGLGSNLGDRKNNIENAIRKIKSLHFTRVVRVSTIIETLPQGGPAQGKFLNSVAQLETQLLPYELLLELQRIESELGRIRLMRNGPRIIDLDILLYGDVQINETSLCIPHPRMLERDFVMLPLKEISPETAHSMLKKNSPGKGLGRKKVKRAAKPARTTKSTGKTKAKKK